MRNQFHRNLVVFLAQEFDRTGRSAALFSSSSKQTT
jgi:hypothetical protein